MIFTYLFVSVYRFLSWDSNVQKVHVQVLMLPVSQNTCKVSRKGELKESHCSWILATFLVMEILKYQLVDISINKNNLFRGLHSQHFI